MNLPNEGESLPPGDQSGAETKGPRRFGDLQKTITMAQIAKAAGVSQGAISSLLNDRDYGIRVSEKTRERVFKVCREMGYIPNDLRAVVRMYPEMGDFCLLISKRWSAGMTEPEISRITSAALEATGARSRSLTIGRYEDKTDYSNDPEQLPHPISTGVASKFILFGEPNATLIQALLRRGCSLVSLAHDVPIAGVLSLMPDYEKASLQAVEYLFKLGHKQLGIISGPFGATDPKLIELNHGVRTACEQFGIALDAQNIVYGDLSFKAGVAAFDILNSRQPAPSAVFCMSDAAAAGVLAEAQLRGRRVPEDFSVIGCGDDPVGRFTLPALTTVHIPFEEIATRGIEAVEALVNDGVIGEAKKQLFTVHLSERKSCAPFK
ncbi:MAG: Transcriptional regulator, LacI family [Chthoniobacteraceae bacterium]|nr:Transcriptional regulator, LacI family [Chthoniobacteraceae bacterium]